MVEENAKLITIAVAGAGDKKEYQDVRILPGTKARDVLDDLKLQGLALSRPEGGIFAETDNIFDAVAPGQKVYATRSDLSAGLKLR